jgi:hypothetical protein
MEQQIILKQKAGGTKKETLWSTIIDRSTSEKKKYIGNSKLKW